MARTATMYAASRLLSFTRIAVLCVLIAACGGDGQGSASDSSGGAPSSAPNSAPSNGSMTNRNVSISWAPNREKLVNSMGGGYRVYYAARPDFSLSNATVVDVPFTSGAATSTSVSLSLPSGTYYVKVVAYSALNPTGSQPSAPLQVNVPLGS